MTPPTTTSQRLLPALVLGVVQGLTEFLPVSSSGHLVVGSHLLEFSTPSLLFDVTLHVGTLVPVLWLYRRDLLDILRAPLKVFGKASLGELWRADRGLRLGVCVLIGTLPTGVIGALFSDLFARLFSSPPVVGIAFMLTGGILMLTLLRRGPGARDATEPGDSHLSLGPVRSLFVGLAQGFAITPGISRSGTTIAVSLLLGIERTMAARFSFLLSIPAILGAVALHLIKLTPSTAMFAMIYVVGALAAAISGYLALRWLVHLVRRGEMHLFAFYLWPLGLFVLVRQLVFR